MHGYGSLTRQSSLDQERLIGIAEPMYWTISGMRIGDIRPMHSSIMGYSPKTGSVLENALVSSFSSLGSVKKIARPWPTFH
jgi:hypothetical protein